MDEEILEALTKANAKDQDTGLTIEKLMEQTTRNLDTVVMNVRRLRIDRKVQVSNENHLADNAQHAWPATQSIEVTGEAVAQAKREWKEQNHKPILVWLGPVILKQMEEKGNADELREAMKAAAAKETFVNYGNFAQGNDIKQTQRNNDHSSSIKTTQSKTPNPSPKKKVPLWVKILALLAPVAVALIAMWDRLIGIAQ